MKSPTHMRQAWRAIRAVPEIPPRRTTLRSKIAASAATRVKTKNTAGGGAAWFRAIVACTPTRRRTPDDTLVLAISATGGSAETVAAMRRHVGTSMVVGITSVARMPKMRAAKATASRDGFEPSVAARIRTGPRPVAAPARTTATGRRVTCTRRCVMLPSV